MTDIGDAAEETDIGERVALTPAPRAYGTAAAWRRALPDSGPRRRGPPRSSLLWPPACMSGRVQPGVPHNRCPRSPPERCGAPRCASGAGSTWSSRRSNAGAVAPLSEPSSRGAPATMPGDAGPATASRASQPRKAGWPLKSCIHRASTWPSDSPCHHGGTFVWRKVSSCPRRRPLRGDSDRTPLRKEKHGRSLHLPRHV